MTALVSRIYALTAPAQLTRRTVGVVGCAGSEFHCVIAKDEPALVATVGRSVAASLDRAILERLAGLSGAASERLKTMSQESVFRLQLGSAEQAASNDLEKSLRALFSAEVEGDTERDHFRRYGLVPMPPKLLNSWCVLELLSATTFIATKTKLQKMLFAMHESLELSGYTAPRFKFVRYVYGPFSNALDGIVRPIKQMGLSTVGRWANAEA